MMKFYIPVIIVLALFLAGCEGDIRHDIQTGGEGSLTGMVITPTPQRIGIETDEVFYLDWRPGYEPPAEFTVSLRYVDPDNTTSPILTVLDDLDPINPGHYRLEPSWYLDSSAFLMLTVTGDGESTRAMYLTEPPPLYSVKTRRHEGGQAEHIIKTGK